ncbi:hypothetical protein ABFX02_14G163700 [Erythranthe guttata]
MEEGKMKAHYNISMSRRTRKPVNYVKVEPRQDEEGRSFDERENNGDRSFRERNNDDDIEELHKRSLKQLTDGRRCTLAQYFREEENMLLISREYSVEEEDDNELIDGVIKLKRMVRDCARVFLNRLIKVKHEPYIFRSWRKPKPVSLKYIKHK